jgi:hypothetical protein
MVLAGLEALNERILNPEKNGADLVCDVYRAMEKARRLEMVRESAEDLAIRGAEMSIA